MPILRLSRLRNPGGVRFGSAEIYDVLDACFSGPTAISKYPDVQRIADSLVVGQMTEDKKDERVVLFVKLDPGENLTQETVQAIKQEIRVQRSARHVPYSVSHLNFSRCPAPPYREPRNLIGEPSATAATSARYLPLVVARDLPRVLESWVIWTDTAMHHHNINSSFVLSFCSRFSHVWAGDTYSLPLVSCSVRLCRWEIYRTH